MAVYVYSDNPNTLVALFRANISAGHIREWVVDDVPDLIHTAGGWDQRVFLRPVATATYLKLNVHYFAGVKGTREMFGVISGRVIEMFIAHLSKQIKSVGASKDPQDGDAALG